MKAKLLRWIFCILILSASLKLFSQETRKTILFNDNWKFYKGDAVNADKAIFDDSNWRQLNLPHDWSIEGPFDAKLASGTGFLPGGIGWYRKTFTLSPETNSKKVFIYFDGVYKNSEVWINGNYLGKRPNGFVSFQYDISRHLNKNGKNTIAVKADHSQFADSRWYTGSGIYRNVYLIVTNSIYIDQWGVKFSTPRVSQSSATASVDVSISNQSRLSKPLVVRSRLINKEGKVVAVSQKFIKLDTDSGRKITLSLDVNNPSLWSVDNPELYRLEVSLWDNQRNKLDDYNDYVGIRTIKFDKDKGFFLNGKSMKLKGLCIHDDAGVLGVAVPEEVWARRLKILKDGGCNALRLSHNPHADYLYKLTDRMGFLVMDEAFDEWDLGKNKWIEGWNVGTPGKDGYHSDFKEWAERDLADMVRRHFNRPSIILWSIGNEVDYPNDPYSHEVLNTGNNPQIYGKGYQPTYPKAIRITELAKQLVAVVKKHDTIRPVTTAFAGVVMSNEVGAPEELDIAGYNYQEFRYAEDHKKYPDRVIYGSENGMSYSAWRAVADNEYISGQYLWTGVDYMGEAGRYPVKGNGAGLIDLAGFPKSEYYFRQSLWTDKPMIKLGTAAIPNTGRGKRTIFPTWNYKPGDSVRVSSFTNMPEAELFLNGKSLGKKYLANAAEGVISWDILYRAGELSVKGIKGEVVKQHTLKTAGNAYVIKATIDRGLFTKSGKQVAHIEIELIDQNGIPVFLAENEINVTIEGPAKLLGLENGNLTNHEDALSNKRQAYHGKLLAYIQSQGKAGIVKVNITSPGLKEQIITIPVK